MTNRSVKHTLLGDQFASKPTVRESANVQADEGAQCSAHRVQSRFVLMMLRLLAASPVHRLVAQPTADSARALMTQAAAINKLPTLRDRMPSIALRLRAAAMFKAIGDTNAQADALREAGTCRDAALANHNRACW